VGTKARPRGGAIMLVPKADPEATVGEGGKAKKGCGNAGISRT